MIWAAWLSSLMAVIFAAAVGVQLLRLVDAVKEIDTENKRELRRIQQQVQEMNDRMSRSERIIYHG